MIIIIICLGPCASSPSQHFDKFQNELRTKVIKKRKRLKRENSRVRISSLESSDLRCSNSRKYSTTPNVVGVAALKEKCNQSSSTKTVLLENLNCLNANENMDVKVVNDNGDDDDDYYKDDKVKKVAFSSNRLSSHSFYPPLASLKNRISTIFQRLSLTTGNESKETSLENQNQSFLRPNNTAELTKFFETRSRQIEFESARNEIRTLKCFREGCEVEENREK